MGRDLLRPAKMKSSLLNILGYGIILIIINIPTISSGTTTTVFSTRDPAGVSTTHAPGTESTVSGHVTMTSPPPAPTGAPPVPTVSGAPPAPTVSGAPPAPNVSGAPPAPTVTGAPPAPTVSGTTTQGSGTDGCISNPCINGGTCTSDMNSYTCNCAPGYTGTHCESDIDECGSNPCQNGGSCMDDVNVYNCTCTPEYTGIICDQLRCNTSDNCLPADGECQGGACLCLEDRYGPECTQDCSSAECGDGEVCFNTTACTACNPACNSAGGKCRATGDGPVCFCDVGYSGPTCSGVADMMASLTLLILMTCIVFLMSHSNAVWTCSN